MSKDYKLTLIIQAGGESRRMGENKALKEFLGEPLVQRLVRRLKPLGQEIIIVARDPLDYAFLGLPVYTDVQPGVGALGGLLTGLTVAETQFVAVIACDMPFVNPELLLYQWGLIQERGIDVVIPIHDEEMQPFHAVYRVKTCLPAVQTAIESGQKKVVSWLDQVVTYKISAAEMLTFRAYAMTFLDLDTPNEFKLAEKIAGNYRD
jgi:molybdopterin-guanine dinucleotide biosynthesis protein A